MITAEICKLYGWTYEEYLDQPYWFTETIIEKYMIDRSKEPKK